MAETVFRVVGKNIPRPDGYDKAQGTALYTVDLKVPGMLHAAILRSPHPHARIVRIDTSRAARLPGVKAVLTHQDVPRQFFNGSYRTPRDRELIPFDELVLDDVVRFVGDKVAAVAATDPDIAHEALELIQVEYEVLPAVFDPEEAMRPDAPRVHPDGNLAGKIQREVGEVARGFAEADVIVEGRFEVSRQQHCSIEPHACITAFDSAGRLTVWSSTQTPFPTRTVLATLLDLPESRIRVMPVPVGGGFGAKDELFEEPLVAFLARAAGRPVKLELTREEEFLFRTRHPGVLTHRLGIARDGRLVARSLRVVYNTGAYAAAGPRVTIATGARWMPLYRTPHLRYEGFCVYTNTPVSGAFRGYGNPQAIFALESQIDEAAAAIGMDPLEVRRRNHIQPGDTNVWTGWTIQSCGLAECLARGSERFGWGRRRTAAAPHRRRGVGLAIAMHNSSATPVMPESSTALVKVNEDGTATAMIGVTDIGQGSDTVIGQIVAEVLGLPFHAVTVRSSDTDSSPYDIGTYASRVTRLCGMAALNAATSAREHLLAQAAALLKTDAGDLDCADGFVVVRGQPDRRLAFPEVVMAAQFGPERRQVIGRGMYVPPDNAPSFTAQFVEVEVDTETGQVEVQRIVAAVDVGRAINPMAVEGQIEGALQQAIGYALTEELLVDPETGRVRNPNFESYRFLTAADMPPIETILVETVDPTGPFGAKGVAEVAIVPVAAAIANAIADATGARLRVQPMTPERVLDALEALAPR